MNQILKRSMQMLSAVVTFGGLTLASAQEMPPRQPGLWKQTQYEGKNAHESEVVYQCVDQASDEKFRAMANEMASCVEETVKRNGKTMIGRNVCQIMGSKVTTDYVVSGNMKTEFRIDSSSTHEPPLFGRAQSETVILAEWRGPCKPGQKPGDMIIEEDGETETVSMEGLDNLQGMSEVLQQIQSRQLQAGGTSVDMQELGKMMEQLKKLQKRQP